MLPDENTISASLLVRGLTKNARKKCRAEISLQVKFVICLNNHGNVHFADFDNPRILQQNKGINQDDNTVVLDTQNRGETLTSWQADKCKHHTKIISVQAQLCKWMFDF